MPDLAQTAVPGNQRLPDKKQAFLWDSTSPGLGLRATPNGKPSYVFQGSYAGKDIRITIGSPDAWRIPEAQAKARELQRQIDEGKDPREQKRRALADAQERQVEEAARTVTVGDLWSVYLETGRPKRKEAWKPRYLEDLKNVASAGGIPKKRGTGLTRPGPVYPLLAMPLVSIDEDALKTWFDREAQSGRHQATRALMMFRGFLRWCAAQPKYRALVDRDAGKAPAIVESLPASVRRTDALEAAQVQSWWSGVEQLSNQTASAYLRTLLLTGARREEVAAFTWQQVDFRWSKLTLADKVDVDFRISIAGAQEKTALLRVDSQWYVPEGATPTTHILKPNIGLVPGTELDFTQSVQNEWLCNQLLKALGLPVANCSIETFGPHTVLCVERFDRAWTPDGWLARLPQEDLCQSLGVASTQKYEADGGPGIAECLQVLSKSQASAQDCARFVMAQLAFWLLGAIDGHAKNFSIFMQPGGGYIATPLYDVLSAWPVIGHGHGKIAWQKAKMAMAVPGTQSRQYHLQKIQRRHWKALAEWTRVEGLWPALLEMLAQLDTAIEQVNADLHPSVSPSIAKQIYDGARAQAHRFLAVPD